MSVAASGLELGSASEECTTTPNEVSDPRLAQSLDVLASISRPGTSGPVIAVDLDEVLSQTNAAVAKCAETLMFHSRIDKDTQRS